MPAGRPRIQIDWEELDKLCGIQATEVEIAQWFGCTVDTIENACKRDKGVNFSEYFEQKRVPGKISLRRKQFQIAMDGNVTMLIWLGKQYLGQADKFSMTDQAGEGFTFSKDKKKVEPEDEES